MWIQALLPGEIASRAARGEASKGTSKAIVSLLLLFVVEGLRVNYRFKNRNHHEKLFRYRAECFFKLGEKKKALFD